MTAHNTSTTTPSSWWKLLPDRFFEGSHDADFDGRLALQVHCTATLERFVRVPLATAVAAAMGASLAEPGRARREFEALRFYEPLAAAADVARVFREPPQDIAVEERPLRALHLKDTTIHRRTLRFDSPYTALNPEAGSGFARLRRNAVACAEHWHHGDLARPTLMVLHGFGLDGATMNAQALSLQSFFEAGHDLLFFTFPHHGPRAEAVSPFSGYGVFGNGLLHFNEVTLQAIQELRVVVDHLLSRGVEQVGVTGISLGGYSAALLACVDDRIACCVPVVPAVSPIDAFLEWQPTGFLLSQLMKRHGVSVAQMRGMLAVHNPLTYAPAMAGERMMIVAGAGDRVSAPTHVQLLHRHWPGSRLHWFPGNHVLHFGRDDYLRSMRAHLQRWLSA